MVTQPGPLDDLPTTGLDGGPPHEPSQPDPLLGSQLAHYRILERVGAGGMGVVYKAEDTRLGRTVAVKLVSSGLSHRPTARQRFVQEARAASTLDHRNICTVHAIEETGDGRLFIVMTFYAGETLDKRIRRGRVSEAEALGILRQVGEGLARAHELGVLHRDVKPANLLITADGEVKILDFGLAKLAGRPDAAEPGGVVGSVHYMSPEQVCGLELDARTDVWALGVVLYEMLTGRHPFEAASRAEVLYAIVHDPPQLRALEAAGVSAGLRHLLARVLERNPAARVPSVRALLSELPAGSVLARTAPAALVPHREKSVLVLPFASLGGAEAEDYFSEGLTDEVITDLARIEGLRVLSRGAAARVRAEGNLRALCEELGVEYVLEGGVRRQQQELRLTARLIEPGSGALVWADSYGGRLEDVFAIQRALSRQIVDALKVKLSVSEERTLASREAPDFAAYDVYLQARFEFLRYSEHGLERSRQAIERQLAAAGESTLLLSALGQVHWQFVNAGISSDPSHAAKARACAERVLALDSESVHGQRLLGLVCVREGRLQEGCRLLKRAIAKDPNDTDALAVLASCYGFVGKPYAGVPLARRLTEIDPLTPMYHCIPAVLALMAGAFEHALEPVNRSYGMDPGNPGVAFTRGQALALAGRRDEAVDAFAALERDSPGSFFASVGLALQAALQARPAEVAGRLGPEVQAAAAGDLYYSWCVAQCHALAGDRDASLEWVARAVGLGFVNYPLLAHLDPFLADLRADARFLELLRGARESWEAFET